MIELFHDSMRLIYKRFTRTLGDCRELHIIIHCCLDIQKKYKKAIDEKETIVSFCDGVGGFLHVLMVGLFVTSLYVAKWVSP